MLILCVFGYLSLYSSIGWLPKKRYIVRVFVCEVSAVTQKTQSEKNWQLRSYTNAVEVYFTYNHMRLSGRVGEYNNIKVYIKLVEFGDCNTGSDNRLPIGRYTIYYYYYNILLYYNTMTFFFFKLHKWFRDLSWYLGENDVLV